MTKNFRYSEKPSIPLHYILAASAIILVVFICNTLQPLIGYQSVSLILLLTVSVLPLFFQVGPVLLAAALSAILLNFLFIPPKFTFYIYRLDDLLMFSMYFIIALITGILTTRIRSQERLAKYREERTMIIYSFTKSLAVSANLTEVINISIKTIKEYFDAETLILFAEAGKLSEKPFPASTFTISEKEFGIAGWAFRNNKKAGKYTDTLSSAQAIYYPLATPRSILGIIGIWLKNENFNPEKETLLETFVFQIASSLERESLNEKAKKALLVSESERLQTTLLNSISHEFRTPLATIMWATRSLLDKNTSIDQKVRDELSTEAYLASERLNRLVANLLDMSRLESGNLKLNLKWHDINELINTVLKGLKTELEEHKVIFITSQDLPLIKFDYGLIEQALTNVIINSAIYTPSGSIIEIKVSKENEELLILIEDNGQGLPDEFINKIFEKFYRVPGTKAGGTGLGLSIVKGFIEAHGGTIKAENKEPSGLRFVIRLKTAS